MDGRLVVELKAKEQISDADRATTLSYLKATGTRIGLILNFGTAELDAKRMIRKQYPASTPALP